MQTITPELEAILKAKFQAGADGFRARLEVGGITSGGACEGWLDDADSSISASITLDAHSATIVRWRIAFRTVGFGSDGSLPFVTFFANPYGDNTTVYWDIFGDPTIATLAAFGGQSTADIDFTAGAILLLEVDKDADHLRLKIWAATDAEPGSWGADIASTDGGLEGLQIVLAQGGQLVVSEVRVWEDGVEIGDPFDDFAGRGGDGWGTPASQAGGWTIDTTPPSSAYVVCPASSFQLKTVTTDKSLQMPADQVEIELANESLPYGWGPTSVFATNVRSRLFQWYGDVANEIQDFTGLVDVVTDSRDLLTTKLTLRDLFALLIDQTFSATAPQGADEDGAVRTADNGVYLSMEISDIVADILDRAGWPSADRSITPTSYVLEEFIIQDGWSWRDALIGPDRLAGLVGYSAWADELGVFRFEPTYQGGSLTDPGVPVYTFRSGEDIVSLQDATDQYDLRTRVKIRGPLTTTTLTDTWREIWRTSKLSRPVGVWHDPANPDYIRVVDRGTKTLYTIRQADRVVTNTVSLATAIPYPLGLSGDPADATVYWVLNAPWIYTGTATGNSVKKVRKADNVVLATYAIPNGRWSDLKVSASYLWLTNLDTDRFYSRSKADGTAVADYSHTYGAVVQLNPSGLMIDGTTLHLFWSNAGTTARFLICDESDPTTITNVITTAGTVLVGGEMDTTTHTECYGASDVLGLVAKFTLLEAVDQTDQVYAEAVDTALEDELGALAQSEDRIHDTHPGDPAHPFEIRRDTVDLPVVLSLAQASQTAIRRLEVLSQRRRVLDVGIVGNPALQKGDLVRIEDPITGLAEDFVIDTYRTQMDAEGTYLGTLALLPVTVASDAPTDDGEAT